MSIDDLAKLAGVLGFFISLATFALTRWERRAAIHFGIEAGSQEVSEGDETSFLDTVDFKLINLGERPVVLDFRTLEVRRGSEVLYPWRQDHWGVEDSEVLLSPHESICLRLAKDTFENNLKIDQPKRYDSKSFYALLPFRICISSTARKVFESSNLRYWEAIGEFRRA